MFYPTVQADYPKLPISNEPKQSGRSEALHRSIYAEAHLFEAIAFHPGRSEREDHATTVSYRRAERTI